jgi:hypothetical protein
VQTHFSGVLLVKRSSKSPIVFGFLSGKKKEIQVPTQIVKTVKTQDMS